MIWWINDYVSDLEWQDERKEKLKNLADEALDEMKDKAEDAYKWFSDGLSFTYIDLEVASVNQIILNKNMICFLNLNVEMLPYTFIFCLFD